MGKKKGEKNSAYQSKGERPNVSRWSKNAARKEYCSHSLERTLNQIDAWIRSKNVILTIVNPNTKETNKKFIRVAAKEVWKKYTPYSAKPSGEEV